MKKVLLVVLLMSLGAITYAAIENIKIKTESVKLITHYVGSNINRYDLGDVDCFIEANAYNLFCIKK